MASTTRRPRGIRRQNQRGVSLVEILVALLIVVVASIAALSYFSYGLGGIGKQGNRRAALERARERLEQVMEADQAQLEPPDGEVHWVKFNGAGWDLSPDPPDPPETVPVDELPAQLMETTVQWVDDPAAGTDASARDALALGVKVWFTPDATDDDFNRVYVRTLRSP